MGLRGHRLLSSLLAQQEVEDLRNKLVVGKQTASSDVSGGITSIGEGLIQQLKDKGITFRTDSDSLEHLENSSARGDTLNWSVPGDAGPHWIDVILGPNANDSTVYEEYLHVLEAEKRGWLNTDGDIAAQGEEIMVKQKLLENADWLGMSEKEREDIILWLQDQIGN